MNQYGYQKTWTMRVVKTRHRVTFANGTTATELMKFLEAVPADARFEDMVCGEDDDGSHYIEFFSEQPDSEQP